MTAMISRTRIGPIAIEAGSICPFHQTLSSPAAPATKPAIVKAIVRCSGTLKPSEAIRMGSSLTPCSANPKGVLPSALNAK